MPLVVLLLSLVLWRMRPTVGQEERVEGTVLAAQATYCEPRKEDGCTGTVTLRAQRGRVEKDVTIKVPLGTPISDGCEVISLGELPGRRVVVTEVDDARGRVAEAISAADPPAGAAC